MAGEQEKDTVLQPLQETAEVGLCIDQLGQFADGAAIPLNLFQFLVAMHVLDTQAQKDFLRFIYTFNMNVPGVQEVTFTPQNHQQILTDAVLRLSQDIIRFNTTMTFPRTASDVLENRTVTVTSKSRTFASLQEDPHVRHSSPFSTRVGEYVHKLAEEASPIKNDFTFRRTQKSMQESHPFIAITLEHNKLTKMTVGFRSPHKAHGPSKVLPLPKS
jgi:hypothetical protein